MLNSSIYSIHVCVECGGAVFIGRTNAIMAELLFEKNQETPVITTTADYARR